MHFFRASTLLFAVLLGEVAGVADAAGSAADACRGTVAKEGSKFFSSSYKARHKCLGDVARGKLPAGTDCALEPRAALKTARAAAKLEEKIRGACLDAHVAGSYAADCVAASTVDALVTCTRDSHAAAAVAMLPDLGGVSLVGQTAALKCRKAIGTHLGKVAERRLKEAQKCRRLVDRGGLPDTTNCVLVAEESEKLVGYEAKVEEKIEVACGSGVSSPLAAADMPAPCSADDSSRFYPCARCNLSTITNGLLQSEGVFTGSLVGLEPGTGACIPRDSTQIDLVQESTASALGLSWELEHYRNNAYGCGLTGNYTFLVMNPAGDPAAEAPLWVYLHGGGVGYYDETNTYVAVKTQTENTWNHEETFVDLWEKALLANAFNQNTGQPIDSTLKRRIEEGYRVVAVSMCDHDVYAGLGTPYTNNLKPGAEVNGLQATMAAIDYTVANYPTTHVFAHGTSAGAIGVWALASSYPLEGKRLTGIVADSWISSPRLYTTAAAFTGEPGYPFGPGFEVDGISDKVGYFAAGDIRSWPEARIPDRDFRAVPSLFINGNDDPFCGGNQGPLAEAVAEGLSNCQWYHDGLRQAIDDQPNSPHQFHNVLGYGHVPTNFAGPANTLVDDFLAGVLATGPPNFDVD
jgi:hypothetical protein